MPEHSAAEQDMDNVRIGVIGVGIIGKQHIHRYRDIPGANVVAAADVNADELARVKEANGLEFTCTDYRALLARDDLDAVDVCLHNNLHAPVTCAALEAGKHVFCEKPMAGTYTDAARMMDTARATGRKLSIQVATLFSKETRAARRLIDAGLLGKLYHARSSGFRRRGRPFVDGYATPAFVQKKVAAGGTMYDTGIYHIAQLIYLLDLPQTERVSGKVYQETAMDPGRRESSGYDVEELAVGLVKFAGGLTLDIIESWAIHLDSFGGSAIAGALGGVRLSPFSFHSTVADMEMNATFELDGAERRFHSLDPLQSCYDSPQQHWIAALLGKVDLLPTAEAALETMLISEGIYLSDRLGREVGREEIAELSESTAVAV